MKCSFGHVSFYYWRGVEVSAEGSPAHALGIKELIVNLMWCPRCEKVMEAYE